MNCRAVGWFGALTLAGCVHATMSSRLEGTEYVSAVLTIPSTGPIDVELTVPRGFLPPGPTTLQATFRYAEADWVRKAVVEVVDGREQPFVATRPVAPEGDVVLHYRVTMPVPNSLTGARLLDGSFDQNGLRHLAMHQFLPMLSVPRGAPMRRPAAVQLVVPADFELVTSLPQENDRVVGDDYALLTEGVVEAGHFVSTTSALGTQFVSPDLDLAHLERYAHLEALAEPLLKAQLGSRQRLKLVTVFMLPNPPHGVWQAGLHTGDAILVRWEKLPSQLAIAPESLVFLHELTHVHLPPTEGLPGWVVEGVTDYFAASTALELDGLPDVRLRSMVENAWDRLGTSSTARSAGGKGTVPYSAGAVLAYCVDVRLRKDGSSLAQVLARANVRAGGTAINNGYWEEEIALGSSGAGAYVLRAKTEPLDGPQNCFNEAGLPWVAPPRDWATGLSVPWLSVAVGTTSFGVEIDSRHGIGQSLTGAKAAAVAELLGPQATVAPFAEGDLILTVDGVSVDTLSQLQLEASKAKGRQATSVEVLRGGERVTVSVGSRSPR